MLPSKGGRNGDFFVLSSFLRFLGVGVGVGVFSFMVLRGNVLHCLFMHGSRLVT